MVIARAMIVACLTALKWLFLFLGLLLVALTVAQWLRADEFAQPVTTSIAAGVSVLIALGCGWGAKRFQAMS
ncbi:MAG: hypothetical protein ACRCWO_14315 [Bosea sp. (in: a-proteobacteria)]